MSTPPRRRRSEPRRSQPPGNGGGGWWGTIALGLGVIVAGLGIGALVAVLMQRNSPAAPIVAAVTSTPTALAERTREPIALATIEPPRTPRPTPFASPSTEASGEPSPAVSFIPSSTPAPPVSTPTSTPRPTPQPTRTAVAAPSPDASIVAAATVSRVAVVTASPTPAATLAPTATPAPADAPASPPSAYDEHASAVVRRYLEALIHGDQKTAYGALGQGASSSSGALTEQSFLDSSARITSVKVTRIDASNASVGCEITSAKGRYYGTYHVTAAASGPYISEHDYIKV